MFYILLACTIVSLISLAAVLLVVRLKLLDESKLYFLTSFAAGVMIATTFLDLLPESARVLGAGVFSPAMFGLIAFFMVDRFTVWHSHAHKHNHEVKQNFGQKVLVGDTVHNFLDGIVIAASFLISMPVGISVTLAICAHEIPQEMADFGLLIKSGMKANKAILLNFVSALFAVLGGLLGFVGLGERVHEVAVLTALAGGMFLYIACVDLIPSLRNEGDVQGEPLVRIKAISTILFLLGLLTIYIFGKVS
jgi:zinc and cadmium transporter